MDIRGIMEFDKDELIAFIDGIKYHVENKQVDNILQDLDRFRKRIEEIYNARRVKRKKY